MFIYSRVCVCVKYIKTNLSPPTFLTLFTHMLASYVITTWIQQKKEVTTTWCVLPTTYICNINFTLIPSLHQDKQKKVHWIKLINKLKEELACFGRSTSSFVKWKMIT